MNRADAQAYVNAARTEEERANRKAEVFHILYGGQVFTPAVRWTIVQRPPRWRRSLAAIGRALVKGWEYAIGGHGPGWDRWR